MKEKDACGLNCDVSQLSAVGNLYRFYSLSSVHVLSCLLLLLAEVAESKALFWGLPSSRTWN